MGMMKKLAGIVRDSLSASAVMDDVDSSDPGDEIFHQQVEEAVAGVDDSEELCYADNMESLAMSNMIAEGSPVVPERHGQWNF